MLPLALAWLLALLTPGLAEGAAPHASTILELRPTLEARGAPSAFVIDTFQYDTPFLKQTTPGTAEPDLSQVLLGTRSLRVSTDGDGQQVNLRANGVGPYDLSDAYLRLRLKVQNLEHLRGLYLYLSDDGFGTYDSYLMLPGGPEGAERFLDDGGWGTITVALGTPQGGPQSVDLTRVTDLQLSLVDDGQVPVTAWFAGLDAVARPERGVVTVMFDDARSGVYELALPQAQRYGIRASVAVISDLVGVPGFMTLEQLHLLERFGDWEMVAHHVTDLPEGGFDVIGQEALRFELEGIKRWLISHGFRRGADAIAYPYGGFHDDSLELVRAYFAAGRTILQGAGLETLPPADPYKVRARSVIDTDTTESLRAAIDRAESEKSWLVLVFHQFSNSQAQYDTEFSGIDFALVMAHLAAADVDVLTFSEAALGR